MENVNSFCYCFRPTFTFVDLIQEYGWKIPYWEQFQRHAYDKKVPKLRIQYL